MPKVAPFAKKSHISDEMGKLTLPSIASLIPAERPSVKVDAASKIPSVEPKLSLKEPSSLIQPPLPKESLAFNVMTQSDIARAAAAPKCKDAGDKNAKRPGGLKVIKAPDDLVCFSAS